MSADASPLLILLRHGATDWSDDLRFASRTDVALNEKGERQARRAAEALAASGIRIDRIVTSPAQRARRTAEIVASGSRWPGDIAIDDDLREVDFGPFEGLSAAEIASGELAAEFRGWCDLDPPLGPRGAEPYAAAAERAARAFASATAGRAGCTLLVGHGYLSRLMIARSILGLPIEHLRRMRLDPGRFAVVAWEGAMPRLIALNTTTVDPVRP